MRSIMYISRLLRDSPNLLSDGVCTFEYADVRFSKHLTKYSLGPKTERSCILNIVFVLFFFFNY